MAVAHKLPVLICSATFALTTLPPAWAQTSAENPIIQRSIDGYIRPTFDALDKQTADLSKAMQNLCAKPGAEPLASARAAFVDTVSAWGKAEIVKLGPLSEDHRLERFLYWPDRKGIGLKQVQAAISGDDKSFEDFDALKGKSVAVQGISALEFVLFGTDADGLATPGAAHRCLYGQAISANLNSIAADAAADWRAPDGFARGWANPAPANPHYRNNEESLNDLLAIFVDGLDQARDVRMKAFLGETADGDKPKLAPLWRANATLPLISGNLDGMKALFDASGLGPLAKGENAYISGSIDFEFANADRALKTAGTAAIADQLADAKTRGALSYLRLVTSSLTDLFGVKLAGALGLSAGFSSLDGD